LARVTLFLRTALFSPESENAHIPQGIAIIDGETTEGPAGALTVKTKAYRDSRDRALTGSPRTLTIPWSKIDHVLERE
jgi:hypothetical protein